MASIGMYLQKKGVPCSSKYSSHLRTKYARHCFLQDWQQDMFYHLLEEGLGDLGRASNDELALGPLRQERVEQGAERVVPERHVDQDLQVEITQKPY